MLQKSYTMKANVGVAPVTFNDIYIPASLGEALTDVVESSEYSQQVMTSAVDMMDVGDFTIQLRSYQLNGERHFERIFDFHDNALVTRFCSFSQSVNSLGAYFGAQKAQNRTPAIQKMTDLSAAQQTAAMRNVVNGPAPTLLGDCFRALGGALGLLVDHVYAGIATGLQNVHHWLKQGADHTLRAVGAI